MYFVHEDMTDEQSEVHQFYRDLVKENKEKDQQDQLKIKMQRGQLMVNSETLKAKVSPPTKSSILRMTKTELDVIKAMKLVRGPEHIEKGSQYISYALKVKTTQDVDRAYTKLKIKHADATHISCGYRLNDPIGPFRQEAIDDQDHGVRRLIVKCLHSEEAERIAVFIVCYYGGVHLDRRRFEIAEQLAE